MLSESANSIDTSKFSHSKKVCSTYGAAGLESAVGLADGSPAARVAPILQSATIFSHIWGSDLIAMSVRNNLINAGIVDRIRQATQKAIFRNGLFSASYMPVKTPEEIPFTILGEKSIADPSPIDMELGRVVINIPVEQYAFSVTDIPSGEADIKLNVACQIYCEPWFGHSLRVFPVRFSGNPYDCLESGECIKFLEGYADPIKQEVGAVVEEMLRPQIIEYASGEGSLPDVSVLTKESKIVGLLPSQSKKLFQALAPFDRGEIPMDRLFTNELEKEKAKSEHAADLLQEFLMTVVKVYGPSELADNLESGVVTPDCLVKARQQFAKRFSESIRESTEKYPRLAAVLTAFPGLEGGQTFFIGKTAAGKTLYYLRLMLPNMDDDVQHPSLVYFGYSLCLYSNPQELQNALARIWTIRPKGWNKIDGSWKEYSTRLKRNILGGIDFEKLTDQDPLTACQLAGSKQWRELVRLMSNYQQRS